MAHQLLHDLKRGLGSGEIVPHFQPLIDLTTHGLAGFEILARWNHPQLGVVSPEKFIALAEQSNLIGELTEQIACRAFRIAREVPDNLVLALNISAIQLRDRSLPLLIAQIATDASFSLERLAIEVTETALVDNIELALEIANHFKRLGAKLSLDDFGTGYSSLRNLQSLPFDTLKVDRSFVSSMVSSRESRKIVAAVVGLGRSLGLKTVAEGVETREQAEMLGWLGCDFAQGWLYGKGMPADEAIDFCYNYSSSISGGSTVSLDPTLFLDALPSQRYAQLQAIYDGTPVGLCFLDTQLRWVSINRRMEEIHGEPAAKRLGRCLPEMEPATYAAVKSQLDTALSGQRVPAFRYESAGHATGSVFTSLMVSYEPARDEAGEVIGVSVAVVDITDHVRQAEALRVSEDHFKNMVELNPQVHWSMDADGSNTVISSQWEKITGRPADPDCPVGWLRSVHPDDLDSITGICSAALVSGERIDVEYRVSNGKGGWHWVRSRGAPLQEADGKISKWYGCVELIDEHKLAIETLKGATARLEALIESVPLGIVIAEAPTGRIVSQNARAARMMGQTELEDTCYLPGGAQPRPARPILASELPFATAIAEGRTVHHDLCLHGEDTQDGPWVRLTGTPIRNDAGEIIGALSTMLELGIEYHAWEESSRSHALCT